MNSNNLDRAIAIVVTVALHAMVMLLLGFVVLTAEPVVPENDGGVYVQMGYIDEASGTFEPYVAEVIKPQVEALTEPYVTPETAPEELMVQEVEETVSLEEQRKKEEAEQRRREEQVRREAEERLRAEQREKENKVSSAMMNAFGSPSAESGSKGIASSGEGVQGSPTGNSADGSMVGAGGWGGFSLTGRRCLDLPKPTYNSNVVGTVVVEITVDNEGCVVAATVKAGSATNESLRSAALAAARKARFDKTSKSGHQVGTITYNFKQR